MTRARLIRVTLFLTAVALGLALSSFASVAQADHHTEGAATPHGEDAPHGDDAAHGEPNPLAVDLDLAIWTGVVFVILLGVLSKFAWPAISSALEEREQRIEQNIANAAAKHEEAKQLLAEHEAKLAGAAAEVRELLEEARRDAEHTKTQIVAEAKKAAEQERDRAVRDVEIATDHALKYLAEKSADIAVELAGKVVQQNITADQQAKLVRDAMGKLAAGEPSKN